VESFGGKVRDEVLAVEAFDSLLEAKTVIEAWRNIYNIIRPHSSLEWKTPAAYAASWKEHQKPDSHNEWTDERGPVKSLLHLVGFESFPSPSIDYRPDVADARTVTPPPCFTRPRAESIGVWRREELDGRSRAKPATHANA